MPYVVPKLSDFSPAALDSAVRELLSALDQESAAVASENDWKAFRDRWMARKNGVLTQLNDLWLKGSPKDAKREVGQHVNELKTKVEQAVEAALARTQGGASSGKLAAERLDITLPGIRRPIGAEHPVIKTMNEMIAVFRNLGYSVEEGPEIETDFYNFEALNFPPNHPARDTQDTLFIAGQESKPPRDRLLLRTHTSPVQIRTMQKMKPPVRVVCPGKVHRNDALDATHSPIFHQIEGLAVDTNITFCDLKGTLDHAMKAMFGSSVKTRFYPSFFPFHRAQRRRADQLYFLRWQRHARRRSLPQLQGQRMDRTARLRHGRSECVRLRGLRREQVLRLRLRNGRGTNRNSEVRRG
jgi:phenylalanyl-tRNA synthetase alpha chain